MFVSKLKHQYLAYFLFTLSIRISSIIEYFQAHDFTRVVVSVVIVSVFAFLLYCAVFCVRMLIKLIPINKKRQSDFLTNNSTPNIIE